MLSFFSCEHEVALPVSVDFSYAVANNDYSVPVQITFSNATEGADTYQWTFEGGLPMSSEKRNPGTIVYEKAGVYPIRLLAQNRDGSSDLKEIQIAVDPAIEVGFLVEVLENNFPPMEVALTSTSVGANTYRWSFEGGTPSSSDQEHPPRVVFQNPGIYPIVLEVSNGKETYQTSTTVSVAPHLAVDFDFELAFEDNDHQVPVSLSLQSIATSVTDYSWSFSGATPATSAQANPNIVLSDPGIQTLTLTASNGKETQTLSKIIELLPNTNLRIFNDIKLGVSTAHNLDTIGAFFAAKLRKVFSKNGVTDADGKFIDLVFLGLNDRFTFNRFLSPNQGRAFGFDSIPNATHTKIINRLEDCNCSVSLSAVSFDAMENDGVLRKLYIKETLSGSQDFDSSELPRIVLFETEDGRVGAVKIKAFVANGLASYVLVDIKIMKEGREMERR